MEYQHVRRGLFLNEFLKIFVIVYQPFGVKLKSRNSNTFSGLAVITVIYKFIFEFFISLLQTYPLIIPFDNTMLIVEVFEKYIFFFLRFNLFCFCSMKLSIIYSNFLGVWFIFKLHPIFFFEKVYLFRRLVCSFRMFLDIRSLEFSKKFGAALRM